MDSIKCGGYDFKKRRCVRAEEGIVPGGGTALVYASRTLDAIKSKCENFDQTVSLFQLLSLQVLRKLPRSQVAATSCHGSLWCMP